MWTEQSKSFCSTFGIAAPIIQAPMAGGPSTPELVAAVSEAGGLGSIATGYMKPDALTKTIATVKSATAKPFSANLFVPPPTIDNYDTGDAAKTELEAIASDLGVTHLDFDAQPDVAIDSLVDILIDEKVPIVSFTFGILPPETMDQFKSIGTKLIGTATCVEEGIQLQTAGCDAIVAQGFEAGGHRGSFLEGELPRVGLMALVPQLVDAVGIPVIASGAIMDGRGIAAALILGASAVQMGTAFLTCTESGANDSWKQHVGLSQDSSTVVTKTFSGKHARGIRNKFIDRMTPHEHALSDYPVQNANTGAIRAAAKEKNDPEYQSLWAGQGAPLSRTVGARELLQTLAQETNTALGK
jgi:nitronate monooxygenase